MTTEEAVRLWLDQEPCPATPQPVQRWRWASFDTWARDRHRARVRTHRARRAVRNVKNVKTEGAAP